MISTVLKSGFVKRWPRIINYRDYNKFDPLKFRIDLREELRNCHRDEATYDHFNTTVEKVLNKHAPLKKKSVRANDGPFMTKALRKAIVGKTGLRNVYNKWTTLENWNAFKKQRNRCVKTLRKVKVDYCGNLQLKDISDNINFWRKLKPLFSDKIQIPGSITLIDGYELVSDDKKVAEILNDYFVIITASLEISEVEENLTKTNELRDPLDIAVNAYKRHPSIQLIKQRVTVSETFSFQHVFIKQILSKLKNLDPT